MSIRKAISKKKRFEIFKRDDFTCQYCGATPTNAILHVDHITAVSNGGTNEMDNLITSCMPCNLGKSSNSLQSIPQSLKDKANEIKEREAQIKGYQEIIEQKLARINQESWKIAEILSPGSSKHGFNTRDFKSIERFVDKIGLYEAMEAAEIAKGKFRYSLKKSFPYFCGICWNKIRGN